MRVIAGTRKSIQLKTLPGNNTRPTTDRIKETLFNMLAPYIYECRFLDIFAGSGGIGIEALSRGALKCCMIEKKPKAAAVIRDNIKKTGFDEEAVLLTADALKVFDRECTSEPYDVIFMDPPYDNGLERLIAEKLDGSSWIADGALVVIEASLKTDFSWIEDNGYSLIKEKKYKTNKHIFIKYNMPRTE